jgi:aspartate/methionine/tyrosine aminotransferase
MPVQIQPMHVAGRVNRFTYAIRNIVVEAQKVEAAGRRVKYLNIGDPVAFGFRTPEPLVEAMARAERDGHNGYVPSPGIAAAREAVASDWSRQGFPATPDRVLITAGTSEGIELALTAMADPGDDVLVPMPTYPLYTAVLAKIGAEARYYRKDAANGWLPDLEHLESLVTPRTRALVVTDPNNPTGAGYPEEPRWALLDFADRHGLAILADEVYVDLAYDGSIAPLVGLAPDAPVISFSSLSKAYLAPGWRAGWMVVGRSPRLDDVLAAIRKLADGRLCSNGPAQYAIAPALLGDRSHQDTFRADLRARAEVTAAAFNELPGFSCVPPHGAFYAMPRMTLRPGDTDEQFILGLLREEGVLCVYGSGFGMPADQGFFRVVFLAPVGELHAIYDSIGRYARRYLSL